MTRRSSRHCLVAGWIVLIWLLGPNSGRAQRVTAADYARAEQMLPGRADTLVYRVDPGPGGLGGVQPIRPHWIGNGPAFWYRVRTPRGVEFMYADPSRKERRPAFDHARLASALSRATVQAHAPYRWPFTAIELRTGSVRFALDKAGWGCDLESYRCEADPRVAPAPPGEARSPNGRWSVVLREHDLWVRNLATGAGRQLTRDGEERYGWGPLPGGSTRSITQIRSGQPWTPVVVWAPDSTRFLSFHLDERRVDELHLLQSVHPESKRPRLWSYPYPVPGDSVIPLARLAIFDPSNGTRVDVRSDPLHVLWLDPVSLQHAWWSEDGRTIYFIEWERGRRAYRLEAADAATGATRTILEERGRTLVEPHPYLAARPNIRVIAGGQEVIWYSERDGWAHLYRFDATTGQLRNRITTGEYAVHEILHVDQKAGRVYFTARGREVGRDRYFRHAYSARLDGTGLTLLTPEDAEHEPTVSPDGTFLVDTYSTPTQPPITVVRSADGGLVQRLEEADVAALRAAGWRTPERFRVKAADGATDVYGAIYLPSKLDPARRYPVLDDIYPGPQVSQAPVAFEAGSHPQALAELGFVVVTLDGRGTPLRSKAFHDYSYGNLESGGALDDHIAGMKQLAEQRPYLDLTRVGIYGFSGGGFASARALMMYPDFFDVAVSAAGNHDQRGNIAVWGETYQGMPEGKNYDAQANASLARNLRGKLLLVYGDMDDNVNPALTIQLIDALVKENRKFDLLILPNRNHGFGNDPYFIARRWDYFVEHLLGQKPPDYVLRPAGGS